ncbi:protein brambleberry [Galendromus occidentalis]|uniref:Protein brambleberry n=1 Tax=Galendromus occidentalis TaxID=34638 RepID=A0AAJ7WK49_9ACAR|nr:protein brambleberry [Galendromus occidentalis]
MKLILVLILASYPVSVVPFLSIFKWTLSGEETPSSETYASADSTAALAVDVAFDLSPTDEKFLQEAKKLDLEAVGNDSPLADCHRRLVLSLRKKCGHLDDEQIGKMAVNLLNCQNAIERRPQFPCKSSMTLAECTKPMDPNSWTVYQLMTNRALALCHSVNQQLFRARVEMLVSHLAIASKDQLGELQEMHEWHGKLMNLQASAAEQMNVLNDQHESMVSRHEELLAKQKNLETALNENVMQLSTDQKILESGSHQLIKITNEVKTHLDSTVAEVQRQEELLKIQRQTMDQILKLYETSLRELLTELEGRGESLLALQDLTYLKVQASLEGISKVNESLGALGSLLMTIQNTVSDHTRWARSLIIEHEVDGDTATFASHFGLLALMMVVGSFLQFPFVSRLIIITATPLNFYLKLTSDYHASLTELLVAVASVTVVEIVLTKLRAKQKPASKEEFHKLVESIKTMEERINVIAMLSPSKDHQFKEPYAPSDLEKFIASSAEYIDPNGNLEWDQASVAQSDYSSSTQQSGLEKTRCQGTNKDGTQCKRMTSKALCPTHRRSSRNRT